MNKILYWTKKVTVILLIIGFVISPNLLGMVKASINMLKDPVVTELNDNKTIKPIELTNLRERNLKVFLNPDYTLEYVYYDQDIHYFDGQSYQEIINRVTENHNSYQVSNSQYEVLLPKHLANNSIELSYLNHKISWKYLGFNNSLIDVNNQPNPEIKYNDILPNVNLEFYFGNSLFKENIILEQYIANFSFSYELNIGDLSLIEEDNQIILTDQNGVGIYCFNPMFMYDINNITSYAIDVEIIKLSSSLYRFIITPNNEWLQSEDIQYPVVIDPIISLDKSETSFAYRSKCYFYQAPSTEIFSSFYVGCPEWEPGGIFTVMELTKPTSNIDFSNANIIITPSSKEGTGGFDVYRLGTGYIYDSINSLPQNVPTNNMTNISNYNFHLNDEIKIPFSSVFPNNISTSILYFKPFGDGLTYLNNYSDPQPVIRITNVTTLFPDANFYDFANGNAGNGKINTATGELTYSFNDAILEHANNPLEIQHNYKSLNANLKTPYGLGWNISYHETIEKVGNNYILTSGNGSKIIFYYLEDNTYQSVDGNKYILTENATSVEVAIGNLTKTYSCFSDSTLLYLKKIKNSQATDDIFIYYTDTINGKAIISIVDGAKNRADFSYNYSTGLLYSINIYKKDFATSTSLKPIDETIEYSIIYTYDNNQCLKNVATRYLGSVENTHPSMINLNYNNLNLISNVYYGNSDLQELGKEFTYCINETGFLNQMKVASFKTYVHQNNNATDIVSFTYGLNKTKVINTDGSYNRYWYDIYGNVVKQDDDKLNVVYYIFDNTPTNQHNLIDINVSNQNYVNYMKNPTYRYSNSWNNNITNNAGSISKINSNLIPGNKQIVLNRTSTSGNLAYEQILNLKKGKYILSTFIKNSSSSGATTSSGAYINVLGNNVNLITSSTKVLNTNNEFKRYFVEFEVINDTNVTISLINDSIGSAYFDYIDLNTATKVSNLNLIEDGSFEYPELNVWNGNVYYEPIGWSSEFGKTQAVISMTSASQIINTGGSRGDYFTFSAFYGYLYNMSFLYDSYIDFVIMFNYTDGTSEEFLIKTKKMGELAETDFSTDSIYNSFYAKKDYSKITVKIKGYITSEVTVDNISLVRTPSRITDLESKINQFPNSLDFDTYEQVLNAQLLFESFTEDELSLLSSFYKNKLSIKYQEALVFDVIKNINALPTISNITIDDIYKVYSVYDKYQLLDVDSLELLGTLLQNLMLARLEKAHVVEVIDAIERLPEEISLNNRYLVYDTEELFNKLTDSEKNQIDNINKNSLNDKILLADTLGSRDITAPLSSSDEEYGYNHQYIIKIIDELMNNTTFTYNSVNGQVTSQTDQLGNTTEYFYNSYELLNEIRQYVTNLSSVGYATITYQYDSLNRLNRITTVSGVYNIIYSSSGYLKEITINNNLLLKVDYAFINGMESDIPSKYTYGNGFVIDYVLNNDNNIIAIKHNNIIRYTYKYDLSGNLIESTDILQNISYYYHYGFNNTLETISDNLGNKVTIGYDENNEITNKDYFVFNKNINIDYFYDEDGNLINEQFNNFSVSYDNNIQTILINSLCISRTLGYTNSFITSVNYIY